MTDARSINALVELYNYTSTIRNAAIELHNIQVKAAKPTLFYDGELQALAQIREKIREQIRETGYQTMVPPEDNQI